MHVNLDEELVDLKGRFLSSARFAVKKARSLRCYHIFLSIPQASTAEKLECLQHGIHTLASMKFPCMAYGISVYVLVPAVTMKNLNQNER